MSIRGPRSQQMRRHGHHRDRGDAILPSATYRLQLGPSLDLRDAADLTSYLAELGISHLYLSPVFEAATASTHGYDVVDPGSVSAAIGGPDAFAALAKAANGLDLGLVIDIVPNHMATRVPDNAWFREVLAHGRSSRFAGHFDIDWGADSRILLPLLGDHYGCELEAGKFQLVRHGSEVEVAYHEHRLPLAPTTLVDPPDGDLARVSADVDAMHDLLERQHYRLASWRLAGEELGYRRFFDITGLIGVRVEDPAVFDDAHRLVIGWADAGLIDGVRVDHPDGLRRPTEYFRRLREALPSSWIVVEKILEPGEELPTTWPVDGTTGYEHLNVLTGLFVDRSAEEPFTALHRELTGETRSFAGVADASKRQVLETVLGAELSRVLRDFATSCAARRTHRDLRASDRRQAVVETLVAFDVYRTYVDDGGHAERTDVERIEAAIDGARRARPDTDELAFELLGRILLGAANEMPSDVECRMRFQQLSGPVMAKSVEDTACYRFARLVALNEVGGDPDRFGIDPADFDRACDDIVHRHPATMVTTGTHDTKRSEDVRLRLAVLTEMPDRWSELLRGWFDRHDPGALIEPDLAILIYQTIVGAHPLTTSRLRDYVEKAAREAKRVTSWIDSDHDYEAAIADFLDRIVGDPEFIRERDDLVTELTRPWAVTAVAHKLVALTMPGIPDLYQGSELWDLHLVDPDNRQPVDFGSRRRSLRRLDEIDPAAIWSTLAATDSVDDGLAKLWVCRQALRLRRARPGTFGPDGGYRRLSTRGPTADHLVAYRRGDDVVVLAPRLVVGLERSGGWGDTEVELPPGEWRDDLTGDRRQGGTRPVAELLTNAPMALLARQDTTDPADPAAPATAAAAARGARA